MRPGRRPGRRGRLRRGSRTGRTGEGDVSGSPEGPETPGPARTAAATTSFACDNAAIRRTDSAKALATTYDTRNAYLLDRVALPRSSFGLPRGRGSLSLPVGTRLLHPPSSPGHQTCWGRPVLRRRGQCCSWERDVVSDPPKGAGSGRKPDSRGRGPSGGPDG